MTESMVSRRGFLTAGAAVLAGAAAAGIAGCAPQSPANQGGGDAATLAATGAGAIPETWDEEADVIVVGFGGSGIVASMAAQDAGASVIVLEKDTMKNGGNMGRSSGCLHDSPGADVDEWVERYVHATLQCGASAEEIRPVLEEASAIMDWITDDYGVAIDWVDQPTDGHTHPSFQHEGYPVSGKSGLSLFNDLNTAAEARGIDVRLDTPATRLVQDPATKEILGVVAEVKGKETYFKAKRGVVMATGGYERNPRMFYDYNLPGIHLIGGGNPMNTGDGFPMVMEVGADLWHMNEFHYGGMGFPAPSRELHQATSPEKGTFGSRVTEPHIFVGRHGKRFMNESYIYAHDQNHKEAFDVSTKFAFDKTFNQSRSTQVQKYDPDCTSDYIHLPMFVVFGQSFYDAHPMIANMTNEEVIERGWMWKGDTIEELAAQMTGDAPCATDECHVAGVDAEALAQTVATYNQYCADGYDPEFLRDQPNLVPLEESGPYYAMELMWTLDFTEGGPRRNGRCQTISVRKEPIPRLYSTGEFGSFNSTFYSIGGLVQACTTGRIAGRDAAGLEPWCE